MMPTLPIEAMIKPSGFICVKEDNLFYFETPNLKPLEVISEILEYHQRAWVAVRILFAMWFCFFIFTLLINCAQAAPPPVGSEDYQLMMPYKEWVTTQHDSLGRWCCDIGDGRPVEARIIEDHWEALVTHEHFPNETSMCPGPKVGPGSSVCVPLGDKGIWVKVPDEKITRNVNPTGSPILWLYQGRVQCFAPPDGV